MSSKWRTHTYRLTQHSHAHTLTTVRQIVYLFFSSFRLLFLRTICAVSPYQIYIVVKICEQINTRRYTYNTRDRREQVDAKKKEKKITTQCVSRFSTQNGIPFFFIKFLLRLEYSLFSLAWNGQKTKCRHNFPQTASNHCASDEQLMVFRFLEFSHCSLLLTADGRVENFLARRQWKFIKQNVCAPTSINKTIVFGLRLQHDCWCPSKRPRRVHVTRRTHGMRLHGERQIHNAPFASFTIRALNANARDEFGTKFKCTSTGWLSAIISQINLAGLIHGHRVDEPDDSTKLRQFTARSIPIGDQT